MQRIVKIFIKIFIVLLFLAVSAHMMFMIAFFITYGKEQPVDFLLIEQCIDYGVGGWDYETRSCRWIKQ
ncbi:MAG: hypothetical protein LBG67_00200 [Campylobacteraceae bacterium]|jgi:hypothetical protein|nr:hypothetical protein [Campylobacteraceae bacterium]